MYRLSQALETNTPTHCGCNPRRCRNNRMKLEVDRHTIYWSSLITRMSQGVTTSSFIRGLSVMTHSSYADYVDFDLLA